MTDIIILAGRLGTRLSSVSGGIPKALLPVGGVVYLDILLKNILKFDIDKIYLSLHNQPRLFMEYLKKRNFKAHIKPIIEPVPMGTGGAINYVIKNSAIAKSFFVINGDSLSNINLNKMKYAYSKENFKTLIGVSHVNNKKRYGSVNIKNGLVVSFEEKNRNGPGWINNGYYLLSQDIFNEVSGPFSIEKTIFPNLVTNQQLVAFKVINDDFIDMGIPEDYKKLCTMYGGNE